MANENEIIEKIQSVLETHIKPAVASHGGNIAFVSFNDGHLVLELQGACSGCSGSTATLQYGVENMMHHFVPEVKTIEAQNDPFSTVDPFYSDDMGYAHWDTIDTIDISEDTDEPTN